MHTPWDGDSTTCSRITQEMMCSRFPDFGSNLYSTKTTVAPLEMQCSESRLRGLENKSYEERKPGADLSSVWMVE